MALCEGCLCRNSGEMSESTHESDNRRRIERTNQVLLEWGWVRGCCKELLDMCGVCDTWHRTSTPLSALLPAASPLMTC